MDESEIMLGLDIQSVLTQCPYCMEEIELIVDPSVSEQQYIEDCQVCCRPMIVTVSIDKDGVTLSTQSDNE